MFSALHAFRHLEGYRDERQQRKIPHPARPNSRHAHRQAQKLHQPGAARRKEGRIHRVRTLERYGLATETEPGRWVVSDRAESALKELGERNDIIKTMHQALANHGLAGKRGMSQYVCHGEKSG